MTINEIQAALNDLVGYVIDRQEEMSDGTCGGLRIHFADDINQYVDVSTDGKQIYLSAYDGAILEETSTLDFIDANAIEQFIAYNLDHDDDAREMSDENL